jgi:hypothetical protein
VTIGTIVGALKELRGATSPKELTLLINVLNILYAAIWMF